MTGVPAAAPPTSFDALFAAANDRHPVRRRAYLHRAGEPLLHAYLVTAGWFGRFRVNAGGTEAFSAVYIPGDVIGLDAMPSGRLDDEVAALVEASVLRLPLERLTESVDQGGPLTREAVRLLVADTGLLRETLFAVGAQSSTERVASFMLQTHGRMIAAGLIPAGADRFRMPLTQVQLGAVTGLTSVHVNRVLRRLRLDGLLDFQGGIVRVLDLPGLRRAAQKRT